MKSDLVEVSLALGSNLGNRLANLDQARIELSKRSTLQQCSQIYETPPWGFTDQPSFYNQVVLATTNLSALDLLRFVKEIETRMGRISTFRNGPRLIDIDLLLFGNQQINTPELVIPHPRMLERGFVLVPLAEVAPNLPIPGKPHTVIQYLQLVDRSGIQIIKPKEKEG